MPPAHLTPASMSQDILPALGSHGSLNPPIIKLLVATKPQVDHSLMGGNAHKTDSLQVPYLTGLWAYTSGLCNHFSAMEYLKHTYTLYPSSISLYH